MYRWLPLVGCLCFTLLRAVEFSIGQSFQIVLNGVPDATKPLVPDATVFDIDMFDTPAEVVAAMKSLGKIIVCYFSAGTYEAWRPDAITFQATDLGLPLEQWPGEYWLNTSSDRVRSIMTTRIQQAASKGCDAVDPDNTDVYQNLNGLGVTRNESIDYIRFLAATAAANGLKVGLKNSLGIISEVQDVVHFAVNEQCAVMQECAMYTGFLALQKPVFHIEYPFGVPNVNATEKVLFCQNPNVGRMTTVLKALRLDGWVQYCDGRSYNTSTVPGGINHWSSSIPPFLSLSTTWRSSSTSRPVSTTRPVTTSKPVTTTSKPVSTSKTSSSVRSTTSSSPPGSCTVAHWGQCGGQDYHGCTICATGFKCTPLSPPWYYQCL